MEFLELAQRRYSVRAYKKDAVEQDKLDTVLEAARVAPTAANRQPFQFVVIRPSGKEAELRKIYDKAWFAEAPVVVCVCGIPAQAWVRKDGKNYCDVDVAIAMDHLVLAATSLGLGTCWIAAFDPAVARQVLALPDGVEPVTFTPVGNTNDQQRPKKRKALTEIVKS